MNLSWIAVALFLLPQDRGLTVGEEPETLSSGAVRMTLGASLRREPDGGMLFQVPRVQADLGLSEWAELGVEWDLRGVSGEGTGLGQGDPIWRLKIVPFRRDGWALGGVAAFKLPSADHEVSTGTDSGDAFLRSFVTRSWEEWTVGVTLGLAVLGDPAERADVDPLFTWSAWARWRIAEAWNALAELHGSAGNRVARDVGEGSLGGGWVSARAGVSREFGEWAVGIAAEAGLTGESPDYELVLQVSKTWDVLSPAQRSDVDDGLAVLDPFPTRAAETLPTGGVVVQLDGEARAQADGTELFAIPRLTVAFAVGGAADARFTADLRTVDGESAPGDCFAEVRWIPLRIDDVGAGLLLGGKIPLSGSRHAVSTGEVDWFGRVLFTWSPCVLAFYANAGMAVNDNPGEFHRQIDSFLWGLAARLRFAARTVASLGLDGSRSSGRVRNLAEGWAGGNMVSLRGAVQFGTGPWEATLSGAAGLTDDSPSWEASLGVSLWIR